MWLSNLLYSISNIHIYWKCENVVMQNALMKKVGTDSAGFPSSIDALDIKEVWENSLAV